MDLSGKILVVDDEFLFRASLRTLLERIGFIVVEADQGEACLEICVREHPDLVLLDINMPGKNGFDVCRCLKAIPELRETPVIFVSALMETRDKVEAFASGGVDYVTKPFQFEEVEARVRTHLALRRQQLQLKESQNSLQGALSEACQTNRLLIEVNERLRQSEELKGHFIANMRNEINDPLGSIIGLATEICDPRLPVERSRALAGQIKAEALHLEFQLRNIFCAAELEAGEASPFITTVDVASVLRDVEDTFSDEAKGKLQTLIVHMPEGGNLFATDAEKLRVILANLLANAIEFSPSGGHIELRTFQQDGVLVLEVKDNGPGLNEVERSVIFERFRQLDVGYARAHRGQGLGLAVAKALAELLGGQILVDSESGRGSVFTCRLPPAPLTEGVDMSSFDGNLFIFDEPSRL
jgi:signal transduction histidine kinase